MKNKALYVFTFFIFVFCLQKQAHAQENVCWVNWQNDVLDSRGNAGRIDSFRAWLQVIDASYNGHSSECNVYADSPDDLAGFTDMIWFSTWYYYDPETVGDFVPVNDGDWPHITMSDSTISLEITHDVKIGNASLSMFQDSNADAFPNSNYTHADYLEDFTNILSAQGFTPPETDLIVIDATAANLSCESQGGHVWLSDVLLLANAGERMGSGCWKNAGNAYICDGNLKPGESPLNYEDPNSADYLKWCDSSTVTENPENEEECQNVGYQYFDADRDGYGNPNRKRLHCFDKLRPSQRPNPHDLLNRLDRFFVNNDDDCDDSNAEINPSAAEICDGVDNNCSGSVDDHSDFSTLNQGCSAGIGGCEESGVYVCSADGLSVECNAVSSSPKEEICDNGIDEDCNGIADDENVCVVEDDPEPYDDEPDSTVEICNNVDSSNQPIDDDNDGMANCEDSDCATAAVCITTREPDETCSALEDGTPNCQDIDCWTDEACVPILEDDADGDGFTIQDGDCADDLTLFPNATNINPGSDEVCDAIDNDCDGQIDEDNICIVNQSPGTPDTPTSSSGGCQLNNSAIKPSYKNSLLVLISIMTLALLIQRQRQFKK